MLIPCTKKPDNICTKKPDYTGFVLVEDQPHLPVIYKMKVKSLVACYNFIKFKDVAYNGCNQKAG